MSPKDQIVIDILFFIPLCGYIALKIPVPGKRDSEDWKERVYFHVCRLIVAFVIMTFGYYLRTGKFLWS